MPLDKFVMRLEDGQVAGITAIKPNTGEILHSAGYMRANSLTCQLAQVISAIARMNEPDFAPTIVQPTTRGAGRMLKGRYPYFDYIVMDDMGTGSDYLVLKKGGAVEQSQGLMRRHTVLGHPRRYRGDTGEIYHVAIVPPHLRGNEARGFISKGYDLTAK